MTHPAPRWQRLLQSPWLHPLNDRAGVNRLLQRFEPLWSLNEVRAQVLAVTEENHDTVSVLLRPNRHWRGHRAGQHVLLQADIDGVRQQRAFSVSSAPQQRRVIRITAKRSPRSRVAAWLHGGLRPGQVLTLSQANGAFVLPAQPAERLLLLAGGSGLTPLLAMLHELEASSPSRDVVLLHSCRDATDRLFVDELQALAARLPGLRVLHHYSGAQGRLDAERLSALLPDLAQREIYQCGPDGLMQTVRALCAALGRSAHLHEEHFGRPPLRDADVLGAAARSVSCDKPEHSFTAAPTQSLLEAAEAAGLTPAFGCRAGICRTCLCRKRRGSVRNLITGHSSDQPDEWIQLCISTAQSDLELAL